MGGNGFDPDRSGLTLLSFPLIQIREHTDLYGCRVYSLLVLRIKKSLIFRISTVFKYSRANWLCCTG